jgi:1,4-alpha-glucan branching enzyme
MIKPNSKNAPGSGAKRVQVHFEFADPKATEVCSAGTFNHWQPEAKTQQSSGTGNWWKEMFLAPGTYEYCLVVDGKWMTDPLAKESVSNPFGGRNSILRVATSPEAAHRADAENIPLKSDRFSESISGDHLIAGENPPLQSVNNQNYEQRNTSR